MNDIVKYEQVKDKLIILRGEPVLLDADIAVLYGVETRAVNQAVKNNPEKFPEGYLFKLDKQENENLRSKILISSVQGSDNQQFPDMLSKKSTSNWGGNRYTPTAFTERGLLYGIYD